MDDRNSERVPLLQIGRQIEPKNCRTPEFDLPVDISQIPKAYQLRPDR
ncbi:15800_t:CDS:2, partial [Cetraspora pellucida]